MARKSRELRLAQTAELIAAYEAAGLGNDRNCRFAQDMKWRLERNKGLSPKRRQWLDSIIEEGVPEPKGDTELLARVEAAGLLHLLQRTQPRLTRREGGELAETPRQRRPRAAGRRGNPRRPGPGCGAPDSQSSTSSRRVEARRRRPGVGKSRRRQI